jgi:hypothetical protein
MGYVTSEVEIYISKHPSIAKMQSCNGLFTVGTCHQSDQNNRNKAKVKIAP